MPELLNTKIGNGEIVFISAVDEVPPKTEKKGNTTINTAGTPGSPAHYETNHMIETTFQEGGVQFVNAFYWQGVVLAEEASPYRQVEDKAARSIPAMLRAVADRLDQAIAEYDERRRAKEPPGL